MNCYRFQNGRLMAREDNGRFRNFTLEDFDIEENSDYMICMKCNYGEHIPWIPLLKTGTCPNCGNTHGNKFKEIFLNEQAENIVKQIDDLEEKIGIKSGFINPIMYNDFGKDLKILKSKLDEEIKFCIKQSFI